ncbi:hypothetical protein GEMRC1_011254 [Eukaryota sp. GEM-RC1]
MIELNIGGVLFVSSAGTLSNRNGYFPPLLSESTDFLFVDRDPSNFRTILNYLRDGKVPLPQDELQLQRLHKESMYYQVTDLTTTIKDLLELLKKPKIYKYRVVQLDGLSASHIEGTVNSLAEDGFVFDPRATFSTIKDSCLLFRCPVEVEAIKEEPKPKSKLQLKKPQLKPIKKDSSSNPSDQPLPSIEKPSETVVDPASAFVLNVKQRDDLVGNQSVNYNRSDTSKWNIVKKYIINATHQRIKLEGGWMVPSTVFLPTRFQVDLVQLPSSSKGGSHDENEKKKVLRKKMPRMSREQS